MTVIINFPSTTTKQTPIKFNTPYTWGAGSYWYVRGEDGLACRLIALKTIDLKQVNQEHFKYEEEVADFRYAKKITLE